MRITRRTSVIIAIVCATGAALLSIVYLRSQAAKVAPPAPTATISVPVPLLTLGAGSRITADKLTLKEFPRESVGQDIVAKSEELEGQRLTAEAAAGMPIPRSKLVAFSPEAGLSYVVPDGLRAVTVGVDNIAGVGGFLKLGDRVDVLSTFDFGQQRIFTKTILQDVLVLAVGAEATSPQPKKPAEGQSTPAAGGQASPPPAEGGPPKVPSVTLAVTPQQAQVLVLAVQRGKLQLAMRPKSDSRVMGLPPTTSDSVMGGLPPPVGAPLPPGAPLTARAASIATRAMPGGGAAAAPGTPGGPGGFGLPGAAGSATSNKPAVDIWRGGQKEVVTP
ncbi:MAG TPA: Flp pilus assembly protein CpaB [Armatimonadota bacterium]|jgi:pilus assembly protein CpaB